MLTRVKPTRSFSDELLTRYRQQGDSPADAVMATVAATAGREGIGTLMQWLADTGDFSTTQQPEAVQQFFADYAKLPNWADPDRMKRSMVFFKKHAGLIGLCLGTYSLPYTYLGADGVQLLWLTERIKNDTARRLQETGEWVFAVNDAKNWIGTADPSDRPNAILYTLKIRLIHAGARWFGLQSGRWNMTWGMPVNQEDMAGTNLSFSYIVLRGLRKLGVSMTEREEEDYLHHINVVSWLNGVTDDLIAHNLREAYHLDRAISKRQFRASEAGAGLVKSLLNAVAELAGGATGSPESIRSLAVGQMRFFLGNDYANDLNLPNVPFEQRLASAVTRLSIFQRLIPAAPAI